MIKVCKIVYSKDNTMAEAKSVFFGIHMLKNLIKKDLIKEGSSILIYNDSKSIVKAIVHNRENNSIESDMMKKIQNEIASLRLENHVEILWINRKCNKEADKLAKATLKTYNEELIRKGEVV